MQGSARRGAAGTHPGAAVPRAKVEARELSVWYQGKPALRRVSLAVAPGEILALVGPSGCGKSTFLRALNRLHDETPGATVRGQVWLDGEPIYGPGVNLTALRMRVGMVFQRPTPFPGSIFENVAFGPRLHGLARGRRLRVLVERALRQVALWEEVRGRLHQSALTLSGGQQQRLCLARALAVDPEVLLLDEPTSALDPAATARLEELLRTLRGDYTLVLVTHNLDQARRLADRVAVFQGGELVEAGPPREVFARPRDPRTAAYLQSWIGPAGQGGSPGGT